MQNKITQTILFSPLDWGLGHTTRSISVLKKWATAHCKLYIACEENSASEAILKTEFPDANFLPLKGYGIHYAKNSRFFSIKIIRQIPKILSAIKYERAQIAEWRALYDFDLIISDNRYGFRNGKIKSVFITHQLQIAASNRAVKKILQWLNYRYINRFSECWIPDFENENSLAGELSHPKLMPKIPVKYIGIQSRLKKAEAEKKYDLLLLLSGPEPQRTVLENEFLKIKNRFKEKVFLVRGLPKEKNELVSTADFTIKNYCDTNELSGIIAQSELVIARSGYSTIMDLFYLKKKAVFIPTPGQTEQEYLAQTLMNRGFAYFFSQNEKDYYRKIEEGKRFDFLFFGVNAVIINTAFTLKTLR